MFGLWSWLNPAPPPPLPPPLLKEPWRKINWGDKQGALDYLNNYKPYIKDQQLRILLYGPAGAGKSSFINSVTSVLRGRLSIDAPVDSTTHGCFTKKYQSYKMQKGNPETFYPFVFTDIMGLGVDKGVLVDDVKMAVSGHVKDGYRFNPEAKLSAEDQFYNKALTDNDKACVLVCVVAIDTLASMTAKAVEKIRDVRLDTSLMGIPQVAVLTKVDDACPEVKRDIKNIYRSKYLKEKMEQFSADVGVPMNSIFPVKNYHEETELSDDTDSVILNTMMHIINFGEDFVNRKLQHGEGGSCRNKSPT